MSTKETSCVSNATNIDGLLHANQKIALADNFRLSLTRESKGHRTSIDTNKTQPGFNFKKFGLYVLI